MSNATIAIIDAALESIGATFGFHDRTFGINGSTEAPSGPTLASDNGLGRVHETTRGCCAAPLGLDRHTHAIGAVSMPISALFFEMRDAMRAISGPTLGFAGRAHALISHTRA